MVAKGKAKILNEAGIHCRPSAHIIKEVKNYSGEMCVRYDGEESDLKSMLSLMMLALTEGAEVDIEVTGPDEETQLEKVIGLLETEYDFPQT
ncbi:MAG: HPr family phosphocarrier protein [Verrucomicrobia bacterium]|nr:HPr family phosphocarrier protein [Verrucomicrobiota bacterium]MCH8514306.1 HPr family phosphocarrier protein [Kiritimatiellia bacterium]